MLSAASGEQKIQEEKHRYRCRIPQRLPPGRFKKPSEKSKPINYSEIVYNRPKSANRAKDDTDNVVREPLMAAQKASYYKSGITQRKSTFNESILVSGNKASKQIITVPLASKQKYTGTMRTLHKNYSTLPDQETIKKCEEEEIQQNLSESPPIKNSEGDLKEKDSRREKVMRLRMNWQEQLVKFENMKSDLNERQRVILELYASLHGTQQKLGALGHKTILPTADDLHVMNVAKMTPEQLLRLCSESKQLSNDNQTMITNTLKLDIRKLNHDMPMKLIAMCEETISKRKEVIDWFETLKNQEKGCKVSNLTKKIKEFNAENEMLHSTLEKVKSEFTMELNEIFDFLRKSVNEIVALQLRTEELTCALSDLHSKNTDLRKHMYNADQRRSHNNKSRIEELERQLKDEKLKTDRLKDRLSRAEGQVRMGDESAHQLETTLSLAQSRIRDLERTVQQLSDQNQKLQLEFDQELSKLNDSIKENTTHLEEIADAREKLQTEKEDLEKRLEELSNHYNESLINIKEEQSRNVAKIIEFEKKYTEEKEERIKQDTQIESLCTQLVETELRYKDTVKLLEEQKMLQNKSSNLENDLQALKIELNKRAIETEEHQQSLVKKTNIIKDLEIKLSDASNVKEKLKCELSHKDKYISELKSTQAFMEEQLQQRDSQMKQYEDQLFTLKNHLAELQERWSDVESLSHLREVVNEQSKKLFEMTEENNNLTEEIEMKNIKLEHQRKSIKEQEDILKQNQNKEEEQVNIIKLLRNNLEMRTHVDSEMNRQLVEKNAEIASLLNNLKRFKQQINQLEKIILTLEDQIQKNTIQKNKDDKKIHILEQKLAKCSRYRSKYNKEVDNPATNLDHLIKIIEDELSSPIDANKNNNFNLINKNLYINPNQLIDFEENTVSDHYNDHGNVPTKIEMGNFFKKTYVPNKNEFAQLQDYGPNKDDFVCNINKCIPYSDMERVHTPTKLIMKNNDLFAHLIPLEDRNVTKYFVPSHLKDEKKRKMFKFVGHRL